MLIYDRHNFRSLLIVLGNLKQSSEMFGNLREVIISIYLVNRILHAYMWLSILSCCVHLNIPQVSAAHLH